MDLAQLGALAAALLVSAVVSITLAARGYRGK
jgi:hypothetical protein